MKSKVTNRAPRIRPTLGAGLNFFLYVKEKVYNVNVSIKYLIIFHQYFSSTFSHSFLVPIYDLTSCSFTIIVLEKKCAFVVLCLDFSFFQYLYSLLI